MKSLSSPLYPQALAWFEGNGWKIEYEINHAVVPKKVNLTLYHNEQKIKNKTIPLDNNLVTDTQQSILNLYLHYHPVKPSN